VIHAFSPRNGYLPFNELQNHVIDSRLTEMPIPWKSEQLIRINIHGCDDVFWQRRFFDHVLRNDESYAQKWNYVRENPVRAGLVAKAEDWPYAGEIIPIDRI
jgi:REP element-mobilizing transposase RayT